MFATKGTGLLVVLDYQRKPFFPLPQIIGNYLVRCAYVGECKY